MDELQRQAWLEQMGLTPWVAVRPLPGAPASPLLDWPEQPVSAQTATKPGSTVSAPPQPSVAPGAESPLRRAMREQNQPPESSAREHLVREEASVGAGEKASTPRASAGTGLRFTFQACPVGDIWVVAAQGEPDLPDFTPPETQLFRNLLRVFRARPGAMRKFEWPVGAMASDDAEAPVWFQGCLEMMVEKGGARVLLCAPEPLARALLSAERYQAVETAGARLLAVSSLEEMLAEPAVHKRRTWQAMVQTGFHA